MAFALVTGATSGIGRAFAELLAERGHDLIIVARDPQRLSQTASELTSRFSRTVETVSADLSHRDDLDRLITRIESVDKPVDVVVNNAGFGLNASLLDPDLDRQHRAMDVMAFAVLALSGAAGRAMKKRGHGTIINVASLSAWIVKGNYSAIKRWVITYSQALALELDQTGVQVCAVCPSWVKTELHERAGVKRPSLPSWAWVEAREVAHAALRGAKRGSVVVVPTIRWAIAAKFLSVAPGIARTVSRTIIRSRRKDG